MNDCTRELIHVPILHSPTDMGNSSSRLEAAYIESFGRQRWREHLALIDHFWQAVTKAVEGLQLDYRRVDLYQDGLPACGRELDIVRDAARDSENFRLLLGLVNRGANLVGTEDPAMLLEEYRAIQAGPSATVAPHSSPTRPAPPSLLDRRNAYIAAQIGRTLQPGRTGLLFLGMLHTLHNHLPPDIVVRRLDILPPVPSPTPKGVRHGSQDSRR